MNRSQYNLNLHFPDPLTILVEFYLHCVGSIIRLSCCGCRKIVTRISFLPKFLKSDAADCSSEIT